MVCPEEGVAPDLAEVGPDEVFARVLFGGFADTAAGGGIRDGGNAGLLRANGKTTSYADSGNLASASGADSGLTEGLERACFPRVVVVLD